MTAHDLSRLTPSDAAATVRSLPRRFRATVRPIDDPEVDRLAEVPGPRGPSAHGHLDAAAALLQRTAVDLQEVQVHDAPALDRDPSDVGVVAQSTSDLDDGLRELENASAALAAGIDAVANEDWNRAAVLGDARLDSLELVRRTLSTALDHLEHARIAIDAARHG